MMSYRLTNFDVFIPQIRIFPWARKVYLLPKIELYPWLDDVIASSLEECRHTEPNQYTLAPQTDCLIIRWLWFTISLHKKLQRGKHK